MINQSDVLVAPRGRVVKDTNLWRSKLLVISLLWVRAQLGSRHVSQVLIASSQMFVSGISHFRTTFPQTQLKMSEIILMGCKTQAPTKTWIL